MSSSESLSSLSSSLVAGLTLAGAAAVQVPTYLLALKAALLGKTALLGGAGGFYLYDQNTRRARTRAAGPGQPLRSSYTQYQS